MANLAYIQITRKCNQECRFCSNPPNTRSISLRQIKNLMDSYIKKRYAGVVFSGGEPTLNPYLKELIEYSRKKRLPCRIITNGQKIADLKYLRSLVDSGLNHICLSLYSDDPAIQDSLTNNKGSLQRLKEALINIGQLGVDTDIVTVINKYNANHLSRIVEWITTDYPFVHHFIWNNLDPLMSRASKNKDSIPRLVDFELELHKAMTYLNNKGKTFRVERVPLCYMAEFAHYSTETRKIVKNEERTTYFLDNKKLVCQKRWQYDKAVCCKRCSLNEICAGLYQMDTYFSSKELYPVFISKEDIIKRILREG